MRRPIIGVPTARRPSLLSFDCEHLPALVIAARWANRVRRHSAAALRTFAELWRMPAVRRFARAQPHLGCFALWNSHEGNQESREIRKGNRLLLALMLVIAIVVELSGDFSITSTITT